MSATSSSNDGIFAALIDLDIRRYATPQLLKIVYILGLAVIALGALGYLFAGLTQGGFIAVLSLVGVPIVTILWILYLRVMVELLSVVFRIAGDVSTIAAAKSQTGGSSGGAAFGGGPPVPPAGPQG